MTDRHDLDAFAPKREIPARLALLGAIRDKVAELKPRNIELGVSEDSGYVVLDEPVEVSLAVPFGDVDTVKIQSLVCWGGDASLSGLEVELWSDGSPYVREADLAAAVAHPGTRYDMYVLPEVPPMFIYSSVKFTSDRDVLNSEFDPAYAVAYVQAAESGEAPAPLYIDDGLASQLIPAIEAISPENIRVTN